MRSFVLGTKRDILNVRVLVGNEKYSQTHFEYETTINKQNNRIILLIIIRSDNNNIKAHKFNQRYESR